MAQPDSIDKIICTYLAAVTNEAFEFKGESYFPKTLHVSPLILRGFGCPPNCGGCCPRFSLDYLPTDRRPDNTTARRICIGAQTIEIYSDLQSSNRSDRCRYLNSNDGRCEIYSSRPFSCDFELIRFTYRQDAWYLCQRLYGRAWAMRRVDKGRGALCYMTPPNDHSIKEVERKLQRLENWATHIGVKTRIQPILDWIASPRHDEPLTLPAPGTARCPPSY